MKSKFIYGSLVLLLLIASTPLDTGNVMSMALEYVQSVELEYLDTLYFDLGVEVVDAGWGWGSLAIVTYTGLLTVLTGNGSTSFIYDMDAVGTSLDVSPDMLIAVGTVSGGFIVDPASGAVERVTPNVSINAVSWGGGIVAMGSSDGWVYVYNERGVPLWNASDPVLEVLDLEWSRDGSRLVVASRLGVFIYNSSGRLIQQVFGLDGTPWDVEWSPDGRYIALGSGTSLIILDSSGNTVSTTSIGTPVYSVSWSNNSKEVAASSATGYVYIYNIETGNLWRSPKLDGPVRAVDWSSDGRLVAAGIERGPLTPARAYIMQPGGEVLWSTSEIYSTVSIVSWSPDSGKLLVAGGGGIHVYSSEGEILYKEGGLLGPLTDTSWSHDSSMIAASSISGDVGAANIPGSFNPIINLPGIEVHSISWDPRGEYIALGTGASVLYTLTVDGEIAWEVQGIGTYIRAVDWSPDGSLLAAGTPFGLFIYNRSGWEQAGYSPGDPITAIAWNRDGSRIGVGTENGIIAILSPGGNAVTTSIGDRINGASWSPDNDLLVIASNSGVYAIASSGSIKWSRNTDTAYTDVSMEHSTYMILEER